MIETPRVKWIWACTGLMVMVAIFAFQSARLKVDIAEAKAEAKSLQERIEALNHSQLDILPEIKKALHEQGVELVEVRDWPNREFYWVDPETRKLILLKPVKNLP